MIILDSTIPLSLSLFSFLHCYFFSTIFSHFLTLSLHSLLCTSSIFSSFITPYASHPHLFLYASISASRVIIEVVFPPPLRFLFSLCFSSVFLYLILILLFFYNCNLCLYVFFIMFIFISQITTFIITKFLLFWHWLLWLLPVPYELSTFQACQLVMDFITIFLGNFWDISWKSSHLPHLVIFGFHVHLEKLETYSDTFTFPFFVLTLSIQCHLSPFRSPALLPFWLPQAWWRSPNPCTSLSLCECMLICVRMDSHVFGGEVR